MSYWKDGETFSPEFLRLARLIREYHVEAVDGQYHDQTECMLDDFQTYATQLGAVATAVALHGPIETMPNEIKSFLGGQLVQIMVSMANMLTTLTSEPEISMTYALNRMSEDAVESIDLLQRQKIERKVQQDTADVIKQAERFINGL